MPFRSYEGWDNPFRPDGEISHEAEELLKQAERAKGAPSADLLQQINVFKWLLTADGRKRAEALVKTGTETAKAAGAAPAAGASRNGGARRCGCALHSPASFWS